VRSKTTPSWYPTNLADLRLQDESQFLRNCRCRRESNSAVILHWTRLQMRSPHCSEALSVLHLEGPWRGTLAEATMRTPATDD
jgi:hypothetical protein